jgi:hypothetical protein
VWKNIALMCKFNYFVGFEAKRHREESSMCVTEKCSKSLSAILRYVSQSLHGRIDLLVKMFLKKFFWKLCFDVLIIYFFIVFHCKMTRMIIKRKIFRGKFSFFFSKNKTFTCFTSKFDLYVSLLENWKS